MNRQVATDRLINCYSARPLLRKKIRKQCSKRLSVWLSDIRQSTAPEPGFSCAVGLLGAAFEGMQGARVKVVRMEVYIWEG